MLFLLLLHIIITFVALSSGFLFYHYIIKEKTGANQYKPVIFYLITGVAVLAIFSQLIALFAPVNGYSQLGILLVIISLLVFSKNHFSSFINHINKKLRGLHFLSVMIFLAGWLLVLLVNSGPLTMSDTECYHIQSIKWIKEFGTVPGLVHLHERYAFNSSWFSLIALLGIPVNNVNYYTALNGTLSVWIIGYFILAMPAKNKTLFFTGIILFAVSLVSWPMIRGNASGSNYDYITAVVIATLFLETINSSSAKTIPSPVEWVIWPAYLFTIRITNLPFLLLSLLAVIFFLKQKNYRLLVICACTGLLLIIPFLIRNIILSGYVLYPSMAFDWFNTDWKADPVKTKELLRYIKYYNRIGTGFLPLEATEKMSFAQWVPAWIKYMYVNDKIIFFPGIIGLLSFPLLMKKVKLFTSAPVRMLMAVTGVQLILWFLVAPDPRFIYGCLWTGVAILSIAASGIVFSARFFQNHVVHFAFSLILVSAFFMLKIINTAPLFNLIYPSPLPQPPLTTIRINNNIQLYIPEKILNNWSPRCYDTKLPCLYEVDPRLRARGTTLAQGFKLNQ